MSHEHVHFVTGRLAEHSLRQTLANLAPRAGFDYSIEVLNITVAALMSCDWVARRIHPSPTATRVVLPGYCDGDLDVVRRAVNLPVERGPRDLRELPEFFGREDPKAAEYGAYDIEILAEINHCPKLSLAEILSTAAKLRADGADLIDVGCNPGETWSGVAETVRALREQGHRVSIDSLNPVEIAAAVQAGAELALSVNSSNVHAALDWGCSVVVIPDDPADASTLEATVEHLATAGVPLRIDPVLSPIAFGFAASLGRYLAVRQRYPDAEMLMGIGNLTELTDADSAAINVVLLGFCEELGIRSVLTTQVIPWARTSVKECDLARRLVFHAHRQRLLPKRVDAQLVMLRDDRLLEHGPDGLADLARQIRDSNFRLFAEGGKLHALASGRHWESDDPFALFEMMQQAREKKLDVGHAFYLGYELSKAMTALTLGKQYRQDQSLDWGFLTQPEPGRHQRERHESGGAAP